MAVREIYLDHAATTPLDPEVADLVAQVQTDCFANPSSPHAAGRRARRLVDETREQILADLGAPHAQLVFTSGATEANALAVHGLVTCKQQLPTEFACSLRDHESLRNAFLESSSKRCRRTTLPLNHSGQLSQTAVKQWLQNKAIEGDRSQTNLSSNSAIRHLLTATLVCGQTGTIEDLAGLIDLIKKSESACRVHADATQAIGKIPIDLATMGVTSLTLAAHKIGGPRGIGCLIVDSKEWLVPLFSGTQQIGQRGGTEPVALIAGCGLAVRQSVRQQQDESKRLFFLQKRLETGLLHAAKQVGITANIIAESTPRSPHLTTVSFSGYDRQAFVLAADLVGLAIATGTACASGSSEPSPALVAMEIEPGFVQSAVRLSFGQTTSVADIDEAISRISQLLLEFAQRNRKE